MTDQYSHADGSRECRPVEGRQLELIEAATALYFAGRWEIPVADPTKPHPCPADSQAAMWERLRDALGLQPGAATEHGIGAESVRQTCACQPAPGYGPCTCGGRRATPAEARGIFDGIEREVIRDLIGGYAREIKELRDRVQGLLEANNREVERRRAGEALLRESAGLYRTYAEHHRSKVEPAAPETSPRELDEAIERLKKAERNEEIAGRIETHLAGASA